MYSDHAQIEHNLFCATVPFTGFSPEITSGMLSMYMRTYIRTHTIHIIVYVCITCIHTIHHKLLAAPVLGTSMICTKHGLSTIYECMNVFPTNSIKTIERKTC